MTNSNRKLLLGSNRLITSDIKYLIIGLLFASIYFFIRYMLVQFDYQGLKIMPEQDSLLYYDNQAYSFFYLPNMHLNLTFWNILTLTPAAFFIALFMTKRHFEIDFNRIASKPIIFKSALFLVAALALYMTINMVYKQTEITDDEITYDFQAKLLLQGKLYTQAPDFQSFKNVFTVSEDKFTGKYPPGTPAIIALGMLFGDRYLFLILMSSLTLVLIYAASKNFYSKSDGVLAAILMLFSPYFVLMSSTRLSHSVSAFFITLFIYIFSIIYTQGSDNKNKVLFLFLALLAGFSAGFAFLTRTMTAPAMLMPFAVYIMIDTIKSKGKGVFLLFLMLAGFLIMLSINLIYNKAISGELFLFPQHFMKTDFVGFVDEYGHTPVKAIFNTIINSIRAGVMMYSFPLVIALIIALLVMKGKNKWDLLLLASILTLPIAYSLYWVQGVYDAGPTYYYEMIIPIVILSARSISRIKSWLVERFPNYSAIIMNFVLVSILFTLVSVLPERLSRIEQLTKEIREPYEKIEQSGINNAIVFMMSLPSKGWMYNQRMPSPDFNDGIMYCRVFDTKSINKVFDSFPNRTFYLASYDFINEKTEIMPFKREDSTIENLSTIFNKGNLKFNENLIFDEDEHRRMNSLILTYMNLKMYDNAEFYATKLMEAGVYTVEMASFYGNMMKLKESEGNQEEANRFKLMLLEIRKRIN